MGFVEHGAKVVEASIESDEVEKIAVLTCGGISPTTGGTFAGVRSLQPHEQTTARCVPHIADEPVAALPSAVREIMAAHRLGITRETACQLGSLR
jgi:hypothetical protein